MGKALKILSYFVGVIIILIGIMFIYEYAAEISTQVKVPHIGWYPIIGSVLIIIGAVICYVGHRSSPRKPSV